MAEQLAITENGTLKPVTEFSRAEKWWCDGEDCGGDGPNGPDLPVPHVHCQMHVHKVNLLTGLSIDSGHHRA